MRQKLKDTKPNVSDYSTPALKIAKIRILEAPEQAAK